MDQSISRIIGLSFSTAFKNIPSLLAAAILWILTIWIPFINVGTTIALFYGMPIELSEDKIMNPLSIFDGKYRKYMGEFFSIIGLMSLSLIPAMVFLIVPAIVIYIGWKFAVLLLIDKELNPTDAMTTSTNFTYGFKWRIFWSIILIWLLTIIICGGITVAIIAMDSAVALILLGLLAFGLLCSIGVATDGVLYKIFIRERWPENEVIQEDDNLNNLTL